MVNQTNSFFDTSINATSVALILWDTQGTSVGKTCASQASLVDTAPGLTKDIDATRTAWAQSALLWSLLHSEDLIEVEALRSFIANSDFVTLGRGERLSSEPSLSQYQKLSSGYIFDFDKMTVTAPEVKWVAITHPKEAQQAQVSTLMAGVLDKFYTSSSGKFI